MKIKELEILEVVLNKYLMLLPIFVISLSAVYSGVALNACNTVIEYSMNRKYSDEKCPLSNIPTVQNHLAQFTKATAAKHFTLNAAKSGGLVMLMPLHK